MAESTNRRMPLRGERSAPKFDGTPRALARYFSELQELFAYAGVVDDVKKVESAKRYLSADDAEIWDTVPEKGADGYDKFKEAVMKLYPGSDGASKYMAEDLDAISKESRAAGTRTRGEEAAYYRKFLPAAMFLDKKGTVSRKEVCMKYLAGFDDETKGSIQRRAEVMFPEKDPWEGFELTDLHDAAQRCLTAVGYGASPSSATGTAGTTSVGATTPIKTEPTYELQQYHQGNGGGSLPANVASRTSFRAYPAPFAGPSANFGGTGGWAPRAGGTGTYGNSGPPTGGTGFGQRSVLRWDVRRDAEDHPPERALPGRYLGGSTMKENVDNWHAAEGLNKGGGNVQDGGNTSADAPPHLSAHLVELVEGFSVASAVSVGDDTEREAKELEEKAEVLAAEAAKLRGARKLVGKHQGKYDEGERGKATRDPCEVGAAGASEVRREAKGDPQYKYTTKLNAERDPMRKADELVDRMLKGGDRPMWDELGEVSIDFRKAMNERTRTYRVPLQSGMVAEEKEEASETSLLVGAGRNIANFECWDSLNLRTVGPTVNGVAGLECVLDTGSQVVLIRRDVWERLGGSLRVDDRVLMETANKSQIRTVGKAVGVRFVFDEDVEVFLNAQIVDIAPFEVLLGRPFFAATSCETKDHPNGRMEVILTDPKTKRRVMIQTYERKPRQPDEGGEGSAGSEGKKTDGGEKEGF
ncbi:uncharacterized protein C8Q71DRAFT_721438 [Rhodofomes roseus]|uniref:Peptidase A2 domain-containing protein n=1 Tax=Rhodofomes roseus TaxID=34475 RepID=A0ABQ8KSV7_9APHY|nr:uncharacterized protein C8Q71DRAFT_721438 [Rhodofomes roseus]KAH9841014.1 hypothetical protein C8Q71DRAFT_721438 [Rhodofomes roseus]